MREGFRGYTPTVEGFVAAKSYLLLNAFEGEQSDIRINPALVKLSHGDLPLSANIAVSQIEGGTVHFTWDGANVEGGNARDQVMLLAYDIENGKAYFTTTGQFRSVGAETLNIDPTPGKTWHFYVAFTAADRSRQSDSVYLGEVTV